MEPTSLKSEDGQRFVREVLASVSAPTVSSEAARAALRPLCMRAAREGMEAAEFLKLLKQCYSDAHTGRRAVDPAVQRQTLERIVSICIDEFYSAR